MIETITELLKTIPSDCTFWIITCVFIALDVIVGTTKAIITKTVSSEKARQGVMHKTGFIFVMLLCSCIDIAQQIIDLGFQIPLLGAATFMICATEIFSIAEHIKELNPDINLSFLQHKEK